MTSCRRRLPLYLLPWLCSAAAFAQSTPEEVARRHFAGIQSEGIGAVVDYMHPDALAEFRDILMPLVELASAGEFRSVVFGGSTTIEEARALTPSEFMRAFVNTFAGEFESLQMRFDDIEIIGVVPEGQVRHVVARMTVSTADFTITQLEVLSFKPFEDTWRLELTGELQGMATALRTAYQLVQGQQ